MANLLSLGAIIGAVVSFAISLIAFVQNTPRAAFRRRKFEVIRALGWTALLVWMHADGTSDEEKAQNIAPNIGALRDYLGRLKDYLHAATELGIIADIASYKTARVLEFAVFEMLLAELLKEADDEKFRSDLYQIKFYNGILDLCLYATEVRVYPPDVKKHFRREILRMRKNIERLDGKDVAEQIPAARKRTFGMVSDKGSRRKLI